jgi:hypothetical protein
MISGIPHKKNWEGIQRMCKSCSIEFEYTNDLERIKIPNYNILYCTNSVIDPDVIPESIKIIYGPHLWIIPEPPMVGKYIPHLEGRCVYNTLSKWVENYCKELGGELIMACAALPFSVNTEDFKPNSYPIVKEYDCIVYVKRRSNIIINNTLSVLNSKGLRYLIFKYGSYKEEDYKYALQVSKFMLTLDAHESQGFALEEAMSCNVPLLVMDATSMYDEMDDGINETYKHLRPKKLLATSVPYWSAECGIKLDSEDCLEDAIDYMINHYNNFTPRDYILRTLSDEVCMRRILSYFNL